MPFRDVHGNAVMLIVGGQRQRRAYSMTGGLMDLSEHPEDTGKCATTRR